MSLTQTIEKYKGLTPNLQAVAGVPDCVVLSDAAITATDKTLTSASDPFVAGDVGKVICVNGAGTAGAALVTTIASVTDAGEIELTAAAATTVSAAVAVFGSDNKDAFSTFRTACNSAGRQYWIPSGWYLTTETVSFEDANIEIAGDARDNVASSVIVYVGTGVGLRVYPSNPANQCFAANIRNLAVVTYGGATDAIKLENLSQANFENVGVGQSAGAYAATGINLVNPNILTFKGSIVQGCANAIIIDSTGFPFDATYVTFSGGNLYQNTTVFDVRANAVHLTIQHMHIEQFTTLLNLDKNNTYLQVERLVVEDNEILAGGGSFTDATLIDCVAPGITTMKLRGFEFSRNRCYFITAKQNPIKFDVSATGTADVNFRLRENVFSNITTSLINTASSPLGIEIIAESNLTMFGSTWTLVDGISTAKVFVPVYGGDGLTSNTGIIRSVNPGKITPVVGLDWFDNCLHISRDPDSTYGQFEISDAAYSRVLRMSIPSAAYTALIKFAGALSALAVNGQVTIGSNEQPTVTLFVHNNDTGGHTQLQVKANAADGSLNAILQLLKSSGDAIIQVMGDGSIYFPAWNYAGILQTSAPYGAASSGKVNLQSADHVAGASLTTGALLKWDGTKVADAAAFTAGRILGTNDSTGAVEVHKVGLANSEHVTVPGSSSDVLINSSGVVGSASLSSLASALADDLKDIFDSVYAPISHNHSGTTGGPSAGTMHNHDVTVT